MAALMYLALTAWGLATGFGLLKRKAWARASVLVFGGLLVSIAVFGSLGMLLVSEIIPRLPGGPPVSAMRTTALVVLAVPGVIGAWWLVYFNLRRVRRGFEEYAVTGYYARDVAAARTLFLKPHPPLSITLIAWMYLAALPFLVWVLFHDFPVILAGRVVVGPAAKVMYWLYLPLIPYVGIGLLKLKHGARILAIVLTVLHLVNSVCFVLLPGLEERTERTLGSVGVVLPPQLTVGMMLPLIHFGLVVGVGFSLLILWLLITRRSAFNGAAARA